MRYIGFVKWTKGNLGMLGRNEGILTSLFMILLDRDSLIGEGLCFRV